METSEHKKNLEIVFDYLSGTGDYQNIEISLLEKLSEGYRSRDRRNYYSFFMEILFIIYNNIGISNRNLQGMLLSQIPTSGGSPITNSGNTGWFIVVFNNILKLFNNFNNLLLLQQKVSGNFKIPPGLNNPAAHQYNSLRIFFNVYGGQNYAMFANTANHLYILGKGPSDFEIYETRNTPRIDFNYLRNLISQSRGKDVVVGVSLKIVGGGGHANLLVISVSQKLIYVIEPNSSARNPYPYGPNLLPFIYKTIEDGLGLPFIQSLGLQKMSGYMQGVDISNTMGRHNYTCAVMCIINYLGYKGVFANRFSAGGANQLDVVGSILKEFCNGFIDPTVTNVTKRYMHLFNGPGEASLGEMRQFNEIEYDFVFKQLLETIPQHVPNDQLVTPQPEIIEDPTGLSLFNLDSVVMSTILEGGSTYIPVPITLFQNQPRLPSLGPITSLTQEELDFFRFGKTRNNEIKYLKNLILN
jgi:hypothetical protein